MAEIAINVPFEASEIVHIAAEELKARMSQLSPLQGSKEYAAFALDFQVKIRLMRAGEEPQQAKETMAWGIKEFGDMPSAEDLDAAAKEMEIAELTSTFESRDPNEERVARDMPLTVEGGDGKGGRARRKVRVKSA